jgi:hypothetical protein
MNQQTQQSGGITRAITPIRSLAELGDEGNYRIAERALIPVLPFSVDPGWYEKYWYGNRPPSRWSLLDNALRRLSSEVHRVGDIIRRAILVRLARHPRCTGFPPSLSQGQALRGNDGRVLVRDETAPVSSRSGSVRRPVWSSQ